MVWHNPISGCARGTGPCGTTDTSVAAAAQMTMGQLGLCLLLLALAAGSHASKIDDLLFEMDQHKYLAGIVRVSRGARTTFEKAVGKVSYELDVPLRSNLSFPIGSNTKLFTAVTVWQLHVSGKLSVYDPVSKYIKPSDFGLAGPWCPRLTNVTTGPCEVPRIHHLLSMSSGLYDILNCGYLPGSPQLKYCATQQGPYQGTFTFTQYANLLLGASSNKEVLRLLGVFSRPLEFRPGTGYSYVNMNFIIAAYIVEQVTGKPIGQVYKERIWDKLGMKRTYYDLSNGQDGLYKDSVPYPCYIPYVSPLNISMPALDASAIGPLTYRSGSTFSSSNPYGPPYARVIKIGVNWASTGIGPAFQNLGGPTGAMWSTVEDMNKWFRTLTTQPQLIGLGTEGFKEMMKVCTTAWYRSSPLLSDQKSFGVDIQFCQGVIAVKDKSYRLGVSGLYYEGSSGGFQAINYVALDAKNPSKDVIINTVSTTVLDKSTVQPFISWAGTANSSSGSSTAALVLPSRSNTPKGSTKSTTTTSGRQCIWTNPGGPAATPGDRTVPSVLCEALVEPPFQLPGLLNYVIATAAEMYSGRPWFGMRPGN